MTTIRILTPARGVVAPDGKPNPIPDKEQTMFTQVERERDEVSGKHLTKYLWQFEAVMTATDPLVCGGGVGGVLTFPAIPATARVTDLYAEIVTALVNSAATQDVDAVNLNSDVAIADANITAAAGLYKVDAGVLPKKYSTTLIPTIVLTGADGVQYTAGKVRLFIETLSYFEA
jgi:hypothetical protein